MTDDIQRLEAELLEDDKFRGLWQQPDPQYELAREFISIRAAAGLTQRELAERTGLTQSQIARLESGRVRPNWQTMARIFQAVGARLELSMTGTDGRTVRLPLSIEPAPVEPPRARRPTTA